MMNKSSLIFSGHVIKYVKLKSYSIIYILEVVFKPRLKREIGLCQTRQERICWPIKYICIFICVYTHTHTGLGRNKLFGEITAISSITLLQVRCCELKTL